MYKLKSIKLFLLMVFALSANAAFQANHDVIFDGDTYPPFVTEDVHMNLTIVKYSKNGNRIIFYGRMWQNSTPFGSLGFRAYIIDFDGANLREISLPQRDDGFTGALEVNSIAINDDGTLAYFGTYSKSQFNTGGTHSIPAKLFKIEITTSINPVSVSEISTVTDVSFRGVQTTSAGDFVFFTDSQERFGGDDFIYRVTSEGSIPQVIVQDNALQFTIASTGCSGRGEHISENFSVSGDGSKIIFQIADIYNDNEYCAFSRYYWVMHSPSATTLLNPENVIGDSGGVVSRDGSKIVIADDDNYYSYNGDGTNHLLIQPQSYNYQGPSITTDGSKYFYRDNIHPYGMILNTDGSGVMPVLAKNWSLGAPAINNIGNLVVYSAGRRIYAGTLFANNNNNTSSPNFDITFDPPYIIEGSTDSVAMYIDTEAVVGEISDVRIDHLTEGKYSDWDASFSHYLTDPVDSGFHGDAVANDGIYTEYSGPRNGGSISNPEAVRVRVTVTDTLGNFKTIEKELNIGIYSNGFD